MRYQAKRVLVVILAAALTFAGLWWASAGWGWYRQDRPLERIFTTTPGVISYRLEWRGDTLVARFLLGPEADLPAVYPSLRRRVAEVLGDRPFRLEVEDRRTPQLEETYRIMRLYLEEALVSGRFSWAAEQVRALAAARGVKEARLRVDGEWLYLELRVGDAYLYEVIPRHPSPAK